MSTLGAQPDQNFLSDEPSFSLIYFSGQVAPRLPALLTSCSYQIVDRASFRGSFAEVFDHISARPGRTIVYKAASSVSNHAVLIDPEMVVGTANDPALLAFCKHQNTTASVAIWERFTKSVIARQLGPSGVLVDFVFVNGSSARRPIHAPADLVRWPAPDRLKEFLASGGAPIDEIFGTISAEVFKLDETKLDAASH